MKRILTLLRAIVYGRPQPWRPPVREHCGSRAHFMGLPCPCQDARDD